MYRLLTPVLESLGARAEGGLLRGTLLRGWILLPMWEMKRPRDITNALMLMAALAVTGIIQHRIHIPCLGKKIGAVLRQSLFL